MGVVLTTLLGAAADDAAAAVLLRLIFDMVRIELIISKSNDCDDCDVVR